MDNRIKNPFTAACEIETEAMKDIIPFIHAQSDDGRFVLTGKGRLSREMQIRYGDALLETNDHMCAVEFKAESENKYGNFFLETWSNRQRFTVGWMYTLDADRLLYYFVQERQMFSIPFNKLRKWAFHDRKIYDFEEKQQGKYPQLNDTWGRCVPIGVIAAQVGMKRYQFFGEHGNYVEVLPNDDPF